MVPDRVLRRQWNSAEVLPLEPQQRVLRTDAKEPISVVELKRLYDTAESERERRDVALQAIDEGVIQTFGPVNISTVDSIFGTRSLRSYQQGRKLNGQLLSISLLQLRASLARRMKLVDPIVGLCRLTTTTTAV